MAVKKDFSQVVNAGRVYDTIAQATAEPEQEAQGIEEPQAKPQPRRRGRPPRSSYTKAEMPELKNDTQTADKKGKLTRINMAFTPDVYQYINIMARVRGENMTDFVNHILRQSMNDHADIYQKAIEFRNSL